MINYCDGESDDDDGENGDDDDDDDDDDNDDNGFFTNRLYQCAIPAHQLALLAPLVRWL